jgi:hypothetical protein
MSGVTGWLMLLGLGGVVAYYVTPHSPERSYAVREWLSVLRVRFASGSFAWFAALFAPRDEAWDDYESEVHDEEMPAARVGGVPVAPRKPNDGPPIPPPVEASPQVVQLADGVWRSGGSFDAAVSRPLSRGERAWDAGRIQVGRAGLLNPPMKRPNETTRSRVAAYLKDAAREHPDVRVSHLIKEASHRFDCTVRTAQLAAQDAGLGRRK